MATQERLRDALRGAIARRSTGVAVATDRSGAVVGTALAGGGAEVIVRTQTTTAAAGAPALLAAISSGDLPPTTVNLTTQDEHGNTVTYAICGLSHCDGPDICA